MSINSVYRMIDEKDLRKLLQAEIESQLAYLSECPPLDHDALERDRRRVFQRPLTKEDIEYVMGRVQFCSYSYDRVDIGAIAILIRTLFPGTPNSECYLGTVLTGFGKLPISTTYGSVNWYSTKTHQANIARLLASIADFDHLFSLFRHVIAEKSCSVFPNATEDLTDVAVLMAAQLGRLQRFIIHAKAEGKAIIEYMI